MAYALAIMGLVLSLAVLWIVSFLLGRPFTVRGLHSRTFLKFALKGPELLTMLGILEKFGIHGHNARLSDASEAFNDRMFAFIRRDLALLRSYPRRRQDAQTGLSTDIMEWFLDDQARGEAFRHHDYPVNQMFGIQSELPNFMTTLHPVTGALEGRNYVRRLSRFGVKLGQVLEGLRIREAKGIIPPRFVIRRVLDEMRAFVAHAPGDNPLCAVLDGKLAKLPRLGQARRQAIVAAARAQVESTVYPAYRALIDYFAALEAKAGDDDGAWKHPDGAAYYAWCLRSSTTTERTPEEVHSIGLAEVERIEAEMRVLLAAQGVRDSANPTRALNAMGAEERFRFPDSDEGREACLAEYRRILSDVEARLEPWFSLKPKAKLDVKRIPEFREKTSAGAYYMPGDMGGLRPGVFYANLRDMKEVQRFGMKTLAYHEGIPGHHFQLSIAQERKGLPMFRRFIPFTAYAEGWAMYSELLAREMGCYEGDPWGLLGSLDSELFRAVRLVVDTGIHCKKWTREQAIDYMRAHSAQERESVVSEIERYIVMPGQACAYKLGMLKLVELRDRARSALGERFSPRDFHTVVLRDGSMPLAILERQVDAWIESVLAGRAVP